MNRSINSPASLRPLLRRALELRGVVVELLLDDALAAPFLKRQLVEQPLLAVAARHLLAADPIAAKTTAASALALAMHHESPVLVDYSRVSLAGALDALGDAEEAQRLRILAWTGALRCGDQFALYDLFCHPHACEHDAGCMRLDEAFVRALQTYLAEAAPAFARSFPSELLQRDMLGLALRGAIGDGVQSKSVERYAADSDRQPKRAASGEQAYNVVAAGRAAGRAVSVLLAPELRARFEERFGQAWASAAGLAEVLRQDEEAEAG